MNRRALAVSIAVLSLAATAANAAPGAPRLRPDGTWARAAYAAVEPASAGALLAGAATGDITPPSGSPMTGFYVDRHCAVSSATEPAIKNADKLRRIQEDPTEAPYRLGQCSSHVAGPDTDLYAKTFPASEGRVGRLRAQAFVIDDGARRIAIVSVDLPGFFGEMHEAVARLIADETGITRENLMVSASHTHTGPGGYFQQNLGWAALGGDVLDPRIFYVISHGIAGAVAQAYRNMRPARIAAGEALIDNANGNRRGAQWQLNPEAILGVDPRNAPRLGMIRIDGTDGAPIGVITSFSTHGVIGSSFNYWLTGDDKAWTGRLVERGIRAESGSVSPAVAVTLNGAQGDIGSGSCNRQWSHMSGADNYDFMCMESSGMRQAPRYLDLWRSLEPELRDDVTVDARFDQVCFCGQAVDDDPYDPFDRGEWVPANDDPAYYNVANLAIQGEGKAPATVFPGHHRRTPLLLGPPGVSPKSVRIGIVRVGDVALVSMPGEPTITMGRRVERSVKAALAGLADHVWVAGLANDHNAYYATIQEYEAYLYEGGWSFYGQQSGNLLKLRQVALARAMALGETVLDCTLERGCLENPDTTGLSARPMPVTRDLEPVAVTQPADVARFEGTSFAWYGGSPTSEWNSAGPWARVERWDGGDWVTVATDADPDLPLEYGKRYGRHRYTVLFDATADLEPGRYRFVAGGGYLEPFGGTFPYSMHSEEFTVRASSALGLVRETTGEWRAANPAPDRLRNFRWRALAPQGWSVTGTLDGAPFTASAPFTLAAGSSLVVPAGGITDAFGNTNGAEITVTG